MTLNLINLNYTLRTSGETRQLADDISANFSPGEVVAITGPSGSGKSTLLSLASGLLPPTSGSVQFCGADLPRNEAERAAVRQRSFAFVFQDIRLIHQLNVFDNIAVPAGLCMQDLARGRSAAEAVYDELAITIPRNAMPYALSGGEKQLIALARALAHRPAVIFADEPTAALDWSRAEGILNQLRIRTRERKLITLMVTHDPRALSFVDHTYQLENGHLHAV